LAVSFINDNEAKALAESCGAAALLDKMNLYHELIPAIKRYPAFASQSPRNQLILPEVVQRLNPSQKGTIRSQVCRHSSAAYPLRSNSNPKPKLQSEIELPHCHTHLCFVVLPTFKLSWHVSIGI
jgi:hypothetical protein